MVDIDSYIVIQPVTLYVSEVLISRSDIKKTVEHQTHNYNWDYPHSFRHSQDTVPRWHGSLYFVQLRRRVQSKHLLLLFQRGLEFATK